MHQTVSRRLLLLHRASLEMISPLTAAEQAQLRDKVRTWRNAMIGREVVKAQGKTTVRGPAWTHQPLACRALCILGVSRSLHGAPRSQHNSTTATCLDCRRFCTA